MIDISPKQRAVEMYSSGMHSREVAKTLGIGTTTVLRWARAAGVIRTVSEALFTGGTIKADGYLAVKRKGRQIRLHREIAEAILARPLSRTEVVHHVNGCRSDNRPANLWVFPTQSAHIQFHNTGIVHPDTIKLIPYCGEVA